MSFKKTIVAVLFLVIGTSDVFANGIYVGAGLGVSNFADRQLITAPTAPATAPTTHDYSGLGLLGSLIGGYNFNVIKHFNLGLEGFINLTNNQIGVDDISIVPATYGQPITAMNMLQRYTYGIRILPGYEIVPNVVGHAIVGVAKSVIRLRDNGAYATAEANFGIVGCQLGLGISAVLLKNLDLRLDVIYTRYPREHYSASGLLPNTTDNYASYYDSMSSLDGVLSLAYRFNL